MYTEQDHDWNIHISVLTFLSPMNSHRRLSWCLGAARSRTCWDSMQGLRQCTYMEWNVSSTVEERLRTCVPRCDACTLAWRALDVEAGDIVPVGTLKITFRNFPDASVLIESSFTSLFIYWLVKQSSRISYSVVLVFVSLWRITAKLLFKPWGHLDSTRRHLCGPCLIVRFTTGSQSWTMPQICMCTV